MQLRQLDPSLKDDFEISFPELFTALNQKTLDIHLLERMSRDFEWNFQKVLIAQVRTHFIMHIKISFHNAYKNHGNVYKKNLNSGGKHTRK